MSDQDYMQLYSIGQTAIREHEFSPRERRLLEAVLDHSYPFDRPGAWFPSRSAFADLTGVGLTKVIETLERLAHKGVLQWVNDPQPRFGSALLVTFLPDVSQWRFVQHRYDTAAKAAKAASLAAWVAEANRLYPQQLSLLPPEPPGLDEAMAEISRENALVAASTARGNITSFGTPCGRVEPVGSDETAQADTIRMYSANSPGFASRQPVNNSLIIPEPGNNEASRTGNRFPIRETTQQGKVPDPGSPLAGARRIAIRSNSNDSPNRDNSCAVALEGNPSRSRGESGKFSDDEKNWLVEQISLLNPDEFHRLNGRDEPECQRTWVARVRDKASIVREALGELKMRETRKPTKGSRLGRLYTICREVAASRNMQFR